VNKTEYGFLGNYKAKIKSNIIGVFLKVFFIRNMFILRRLLVLRKLINYFFTLSIDFCMYITILVIIDISHVLIYNDSAPYRPGSIPGMTTPVTGL
jgi:hypothetical protein